MGHFPDSTGFNFKVIVRDLLYREVYPSPGNIQKKLGRTVTHSLNSQEIKWRDEVWVPWMKENPNHPITVKRGKLRTRTESEYAQLENDDAIAGLRDIILDLS